MDIGFVWDENKYNRVRQKHRVQFHEVVSAFDDLNGYEVPDPERHEDRWMWIGRTAGDRVLAIITSDEDSPLHRLISAFDATGRFLNEYYSRGGI